MPWRYCSTPSSNSMCCLSSQIDINLYKKRKRNLLAYLLSISNVVLLTCKIPSLIPLCNSSLQSRHIYGESETDFGTRPRLNQKKMIQLAEPVRWKAQPSLHLRFDSKSKTKSQFLPVASVIMQKCLKQCREVGTNGSRRSGLKGEGNPGYIWQ